jgi:23S rRNA pseudouridine1911/1915/1917 synthase
MTKIETLYEDAHILVINKPAGLIVNRSQTTKGELTVQDYLEESATKEEEIPVSDSAEEDSLEVLEFKSRNGIVHRLDKDTSGVLIIAKSAEVFYDIQNQFKEREVEKEYYAYLIGEIKDSRFEVNAPIARNPRNRVKMAVTVSGKPAITTVVLDHVFELDGEKYTAVRVFPKTGRTHQIRVHMAALNHPVAGDLLYAGNRRGEATNEKFSRLMLHAHKISFKMPSTGEKREFIAEIPESFVY